MLFLGDGFLEPSRFPPDMLSVIVLIPSALFSTVFLSVIAIYFLLLLLFLVNSTGAKSSLPLVLLTTFKF